MPRISRTDNVRKLCACITWKTCAHPWYIDFKAPRRHATRPNERYRKNLDSAVGFHVESFSDAKNEARRAIVAWLDRRNPADLQPADRPTLSQVLKAYDERPGASLSDRAQLKTLKAVKVQGRLFGDWRAADITREALDAFRQQRPKVAANRNLALLRAMFNWAVADGLVPRSPFRVGDVAVVKLSREDARTRRLQGDEERRLLEACMAGSDAQNRPLPGNPHLRALIVGALETGCRRGELLSLQWQQVRFTPRAEIFLPAQKTKAKKDRRIPISSTLKVLLEARRNDPAGESLPATGYVFGDDIGRRRKSIKTAWRLACTRAKIDELHFHDLRREAGSRWMDAGVPLGTIQRWLGHHNISQTSKYLAASLGGDESDLMRAYEQRIGRVPLTQIDISEGSNGSEPTSTNTATTEITQSNTVVPEAAGVH